MVTTLQYLNCQWSRTPRIIVIKMDFIHLVGSWQQPNLKHTMDAPPSQGNFSTVAIVPISDEVPLTAFTYELYHSLCAIGRLLLLFKNNGSKPCWAVCCEDLQDIHFIIITVIVYVGEAMLQPRQLGMWRDVELVTPSSCKLSSYWHHYASLYWHMLLLLLLLLF